MIISVMMIRTIIHPILQLLYGILAIKQNDELSRDVSTCIHIILCGRCIFSHIQFTSLTKRGKITYFVQGICSTHYNKWNYNNV